MYKYWCDERLKAKDEGSTLLVYTGLCGWLEHLKIETRLIDESCNSLLWNDKSRSKWKTYIQGVGVMKDKEIKLEETETSHTLGGATKYT
jgi:hypothetical protein